MIFQDSMIIPSLYTRDDQEVIERWIKHCLTVPAKDGLDDSNKVAEIVLSSVQGRLPKGISIREDGSTFIGRKTWHCPVAMRNNLIFPIHLLDINWDDSQPGFSWPESYYATFLPGYNVYAVTISQGSADTLGYYDAAVGCFDAKKIDQIAENAARVVQTWWQFQHTELKKNGWKELLKPGLINSESAFRLHKEVWSNVETPGSGCIRS